MFSRLQRHPFAVEALFERSLVLTYALPRSTLQPMLMPGLELDVFKDFGFIAVALVETKHLRPAGLPRWLGRDFFLSGYRIFTRFARPGRATLRGLQILRSDTDKRAMKVLGNVFTHYGYRYAKVTRRVQAGTYEVEVTTPGAEADLHVVADLSKRPGPLPMGTPFASVEEARQYAGPLPYTFGHDASGHIVLVKGVRTIWKPEPVAVEVTRISYFDSPAFSGVKPVLANAFYLENVPYRWTPGSLEPVP